MVAQGCNLNNNNFKKKCTKTPPNVSIYELYSHLAKRWKGKRSDRKGEEESYILYHIRIALYLPGFN